MANEHDEKKPEDTIELSLDDLEEAAGGFILNSGDGRYSVLDKPDGKKYYWGRSLERAKDVARAANVSTTVLTTRDLALMRLRGKL